MHVDEHVLLHDPIGSVALRLDRIVADVLEDIAGDLEPEIGPVPAFGTLPTAWPDGRPDAVIGVIDVVVGEFHIAQYVLGAEQRTVQRAPEMVVRHAPGNVGIDARRTVPVIPYVAGRYASAIARRALLPEISRDLERMGGL